MPSIRFQGTNLDYTESDVITFDEGLIGLPHLRRMVLVRQPEVAPFLWLVPLKDDEAAFIVADPRELFSNYEATLSREFDGLILLAPGETPLLLSIVLIRSDWTHSTANLRAPLVISPRNMKGAQIAVMGSAYRVDEPLPIAAAAA